MKIGGVTERNMTVVRQCLTLALVGGGMAALSYVSAISETVEKNCTTHSSKNMSFLQNVLNQPTGTYF